MQDVPMWLKKQSGSSGNVLTLKAISDNDASEKTQARRTGGTVIEVNNFVSRKRIPRSLRVPVTNVSLEKKRIDHQEERKNVKNPVNIFFFQEYQYMGHTWSPWKLSRPSFCLYSGKLSPNLNLCREKVTISRSSINFIQKLDKKSRKDGTNSANFCKPPKLIQTQFFRVAKKNTLLFVWWGSHPYRPFPKLRALKSVAQRFQAT